MCEPKWWPSKEFHQVFMSLDLGENLDQLVFSWVFLGNFDKIKIYSFAWSISLQYYEQIKYLGDSCCCFICSNWQQSTFRQTCVCFFSKPGYLWLIYTSYRLLYCVYAHRRRVILIQFYCIRKGSSAFPSLHCTHWMIQADGWCKSPFIANPKSTTRIVNGY